MKFISTVVLSIVLTCNAWAQISEGGTPATFNENTEYTAPVVEITTPDEDFLSQQDQEREKNGDVYRVGIAIEQAMNPSTHGAWHTLTDGTEVWQLEIEASGAQAIGVLYNRLNLPEGSKLFLYNADKTQVLGAYTAFNNTDGKWATQPVGGERIILEYNAPYYVTELPVIDMEGIVFNYRGFERLAQSTGFGSSDSCQVNANCSEGDNWRDQQRSVARMYMRIGMTFAYCTGSLVNNTAQDCTPYILSADHCATGASAGDMDQWIFMFNYEGPGCSNPPTQVGINTETVVGCETIARTNGSVQNGSDFLLVELNNNVPASYNPHFNGWSRQNLASPNGVGIHHPSGDIKKISTYTSNTQSVTLGSQPLTHWQVTWSSTANGHGVTEGGSSGSPLYNSDGRVMGVLSAGLSFCSATGDPDWYGKFSYGWLSNGSTDQERLKPWLDPINAGVLNLDGTDMPCSGTSLEEGHIQGVELFPNPASNAVVVHCELAMETDVAISMVNITGQTVYRAEYSNVINRDIRIDVSDLSEGMYTVLVQSNGETHAQRLVIAK